MRQARVEGRRVPVGARRLATMVGFLVAAGLGACDASARDVAAREPAAQRHVIEIEGFAFRPQTLRVAAGDTVVWLNRDVVPHTATDSAGAWDSGALESGASWSLVARAPGETTYLCTLHPTMRGTLIVE